MLKSYGAATAPSHCTVYYYKYYNYYIITIIIIIIWKGYFRVNPIFVFELLKVKKVLLMLMLCLQPNICE